LRSSGSIVTPPAYNRMGLTTKAWFFFSMPPPACRRSNTANEAGIMPAHSSSQTARHFFRCQNCSGMSERRPSVA